MDETQRSDVEHASAELRGLIGKSLAGARVPRETRERIVTILETSMREHVGVLRKYVRALAHNGQAAEMMEMYSAGATLDDVAVKFGLTRERIRQILTSTFGDYRSGVPDEVRHERSLRMLAERTAEFDQRHGGSISALFKAGTSDVEIATTLGVPRSGVVDYRSRKGLRHKRQNGWDTGTLLSTLQLASAEIDGGLTIARYNAWRETKGSLHRPSYLTFIIRFGSFGEACEAAGVTCAARSNSKKRSDYVTVEECRVHLANFIEWAKAGGAPTTTTAFDEYRKETPGTPSKAIITRRLGGFRDAIHEVMDNSSEPVE